MGMSPLNILGWLLGESNENPRASIWRNEHTCVFTILSCYSESTRPPENLLDWLLPKLELEEEMVTKLVVDIGGKTKTITFPGVIRNLEDVFHGGVKVEYHTEKEATMAMPFGYFDALSTSLFLPPSITSFGICWLCTNNHTLRVLSGPFAGETFRKMEFYSTSDVPDVVVRGRPITARA